MTTAGIQKTSDRQAPGAAPGASAYSTASACASITGAIMATAAMTAGRKQGATARPRVSSQPASDHSAKAA